METPPPTSAATTATTLPRIQITYCTQCKWLLRAAYFAQELLSTFSATLGEVALKPSTGGHFYVDLTYRAPNADGSPSAAGAEILEARLWDRKAEGGFPETKVLKQRVRDLLEPGRGLGHSDKPGKGSRVVDGEGKKGEERESGASGGAGEGKNGTEQKEACEDCQ